jgi:hypothetical protein
MARSLEDILKDDAKLKRVVELNIDLLSNIAHIQFGVIENISIKEGKLLWKRQEIRISGNE